MYVVIASWTNVHDEGETAIMADGFDTAEEAYTYSVQVATNLGTGYLVEVCTQEEAEQVITD